MIYHKKDLFERYLVARARLKKIEKNSPKSKDWMYADKEAQTAGMIVSDMVSNGLYFEHGFAILVFSNSVKISRFLGIIHGCFSKACLVALSFIDPRW